MSVLLFVLMLGAVGQQEPRATTLQRAQQELTAGRRAEAKRLLANYEEVLATLCPE